MPKVVKQSSEWDYKVNTRRLWDLTDEQIALLEDNKAKPTFSGVFGNFRDGVPTALGSCTERYEVVNNGDLHGVVDGTLDKHPSLKNYEKRVTVIGNGERVYTQYTWKDSDFNFRVGNPKVGDEMGLRLTVKNSFDRSLRLSVALGFLRLVCTNGMTALEKEFDLTRRHQSGVDISFLSEGIDGALGKISKQREMFNTMASKEISEEQGVSLLNGMVRKGILASSQRDSVEAIWHDPSYDEDKSRNVYNLLNAGTQHITRVIEPKRFEQAQRMTTDMTKALFNASRKESAFESLLLPVKEVANN
jgi:hypothetical protein|tara:strand:+ start:29823 stop:30734 length:912 start_codon:yes stop_codon:yes gene_type:complete